MIIKIKGSKAYLNHFLYFSQDKFRKVKNGVACMLDTPEGIDFLFEDTKYSYTSDYSNQIDYQSLCSPRAALDLFSLFTKHLYKREAFIEDAFEITIPFLYVDGFSIKKNRIRFLDNLSHLVRVDYRVVGNNLISISIKSNTIKFVDLVAMATSVCFYFAASNKDKFFVDQNVADKYFKIFKTFKPRYFTVYQFCQFLCPTEKLFDRYKDELGQIISFNGEAKLNFGNTQRQRVNWVKSNLISPENILEIGCGEGTYPRALIKYISGHWDAVDVQDFSYLENRFESEFSFYSSLDDVEKRDNLTVLFIEVIEHMPPAEGFDLIRRVLSDYQPKRMLITTPNYDFNVHYNLAGYRHDDHHFELTVHEFNTMIQYLEREFPEYSFEYKDVGDVINKVPVTLGCVITK